MTASQRGSNDYKAVKAIDDGATTKIATIAGDDCEQEGGDIAATMTMTARQAARMWEESEINCKRSSNSCLLVEHVRKKCDNQRYQKGDRHMFSVLSFSNSRSSNLQTNC